MSPLLYAVTVLDEEMALAVLQSPTLRPNVDERSAVDVANYSALHHACEHGLVRGVETLLAAGADHRATTQDLSLQMDSVQSGGQTPLHLAAWRGDLGLIEVRRPGRHWNVRR